MRSNKLKQFNKSEYIHGSKGLLLSPFYNARRGLDIIELRLEGA